jgi:hypothetical protein
MNRRLFLSSFLGFLKPELPKDDKSPFYHKINIDPNVVSYEMIDESEAIYSFNSDNKLLCYRLDRFCQIYNYDYYGNEIRYECSDGSWHEYKRNIFNGKVISFKDNTGYWEEFEYDFDGNLKSFTNSNGEFAKYNFNLSNELLSLNTSFNKKVSKTVFGKNLKRIL